MRRSDRCEVAPDDQGASVEATSHPGRPTAVEQIRKHLDPRHLLSTLARNRDLIRQLSSREIRERYQGSLLGVGWALLTPLATLAVYTLVFGFIFRARWDQGETGIASFATVLFAGMVAYNVFGESLARASSLVRSHPNYVKKVVFPLEILPVTTISAALFHSLIGVTIVLVLRWFTNGTVSATVWLLPLAYVPLVAFTLGLSWLLAAVGVFYRDLDSLTPIALNLLFFLTPILYPLTAVPEPLRTFVRANPLSSVVEDFRRTLLWSSAPDWQWLAINTAASLLVALFGYTAFMALRRAFSDVL